jgi:hypothetical protein
VAGDETVRARLVLDEEALAESVGEFVGDDARRDIAGRLG